MRTQTLTKIHSVSLWKHLPLWLQGGMELVWASLWFTGLFSEFVRIPWWNIWLIFWVILLISYGIRILMLTLKQKQFLFQIGFILWTFTAGMLSLKWIFYDQIQIGWKEILLSPWYALTGVEESFLPFFHMMLIPFLILRGIALANSIPEISNVQTDFQTGLVGLLLFGLFYLPVRPELSASGLFLYLWIGLITLSSTRIYAISAFRGGRVSAFTPAWALGLFFFAGLVILAGYLSGILFNSYLGNFILQVFTIVIAVLGGLLILVAFPLLIGIMRLILFIFERLGGRMGDLENAIQKALEQAQALSVQVIESQQQTISVLKIVLPLLLFVITLSAILVWLRQQNRTQHLIAEEEVQSDKPSLQLFSSQQVAKSKKKTLSPKQLLGIARIRRIYLQFESLCARAGKARPLNVTPLEFAEQCKNWFPETWSDIFLITQAYTQVRYGEIPETPEEWQKVTDAWKNIQHQFKTKKPVRRQA